jgi:hypothetical protein
MKSIALVAMAYLILTMSATAASTALLVVLPPSGEGGGFPEHYLGLFMAVAGLLAIGVGYVLARFVRSRPMLHVVVLAGAATVLGIAATAFDWSSDAWGGWLPTFLAGSGPLMAPGLLLGGLLARWLSNSSTASSAA